MNHMYAVPMSQNEILLNDPKIQRREKNKRIQSIKVNKTRRNTPRLSGESAARPPVLTLLPAGCDLPSPAYPEPAPADHRSAPVTAHSPARVIFHASLNAIIKREIEKYWHQNLTSACVKCLSLFWRTNFFLLFFQRWGEVWDSAMNYLF